VGKVDRDELEIPVAALREALANALVHRQYDHENSKEQPTRIELFANRIVVRSFGGLVGDISEESLNDDAENVKPRRRNPIIAQIFMYLTLAELGASGVARMQVAMRKAGRSKPTIKQEQGNPPSVTVTLLRPAAGQGEVVEPAILLPAGLPPDYIDRSSELDDVRRALLKSQSEGLAGGLALHGMGGVGKTVLAKAICLRDPEVRNAFPDGILWADLGQMPDILATQRVWIRALGDEPTKVITIRDGIAVLQKLLQDRAMLLVLDDVWQEEVVQNFLVGGGRCRLLITTRDAETVSGTQLLRLDVMRRSESVQLLQQADPSLDRQTAESIAERLGDLPLALNLVGRQFSLKIPWGAIRSQLDQYDPNAIGSAGKRLGALYGVVASTVDALPDSVKARYRELVIFSDSGRIDEALVHNLWSQTGGLGQWETSELLGILRARSLLLSDNTFHELQADYLKNTVPAEEQIRLRALVRGF
jgi:hypothetical protein